VPGVARHLAIPQGDQLTDFLVQKPECAIAGGVRREPKWLAVRRSEDALGRDVISVLAVASDKVAAAQVAKRKVLDAPEIALTQQRYHFDDLYTS
jgi:hypothetical protein